MSLVSVFNDIANAIRSKTGDGALMTPSQMADNILNISSGGGSYNFGVYENIGGDMVESQYFKAYAKIAPITSYAINRPLKICIGNSVEFLQNTNDGLGGIFGNGIVINGDVYIDGFPGTPVKSIDNIFYGHNFDNNAYNIYLNDSIESAANAFCESGIEHNKTVTIPASLTNGAYMFFRTKRFAQRSVNLPDSLVNGCNMFGFGSSADQCSLFRIEHMPANLVDGSFMFNNAYFPGVISDSKGLYFNNCRIGDNLINAMNMFYNVVASGNLEVGISPEWEALWDDFNINGNTSAYDVLSNVISLPEDIGYLEVSQSYQDPFNCLLMVFDNSKVLEIYQEFMSFLTGSQQGGFFGDGHTWHCDNPVMRSLYFRTAQE